jgi:hypothetical protein
MSPINIGFQFLAIGNTTEATVKVKNVPQFVGLVFFEDRFCGLVVRVPGYRSRGPGFDFR